MRALAFLGCCSLAITWWLGRELDPGDFGRPLGRLAAVLVVVVGLYALASLVVVRATPSRAALVLVLVVAVALRAVLVLHQPVLSNDAVRYVWDGRVQAHGINPYEHPPADAALAPLRDGEIWPHLNRPEVRTIYPPVAQGAFSALYRLHPGSVVWTKLALTLVELAGVALLVLLLVRAGRAPALVLLYAWNPLAVFEIAGTGHVEALAIVLVLLALASRRAFAAGVFVGAAALVKPYALVVLPGLVTGPRRLAIAAAAVAGTVAVAYLPFADAGLHVLGYLPGYLREEGFTSGSRFYLLGLLGGHSDAATAAYFAFAATVLLGLAAAFVLRPRGSAPTRALWLFATLFVLASPTYPWYALLAVALLPLARGAVLAPGWAIALGAPFLYLHVSVGSHPVWPRHLVYGGSALALVAAAAWVALGERRGARANSWTPSAKVVRALKPSRSAARAGEANT